MLYSNKQLKHRKACIVQLLSEHGMTSLSFQTDVQKNEAKLSSFCAVWKRNGAISCSITEQSTTSYVSTVLEHSHIQSDVIACTVL